MRRLCIWLSTWLLLQGPAALAQEPPTINVFSFADTSCDQWKRSKDDLPLRMTYGTWFRGFVSGYNFGNSGNQVPLEKLPDPDAVALYVDNFCRDNPLEPFVAAAIKLIQEIREYRIEIPPVRQ